MLLNWKSLVEHEIEEARARAEEGKGCQADKYSEGNAVVRRDKAGNIKGGKGQGRGCKRGRGAQGKKRATKNRV